MRDFIYLLIFLYDDISILGFFLKKANFFLFHSVKMEVNALLIFENPFIIETLFLKRFIL